MLPRCKYTFEAIKAAPVEHLAVISGQESLQRATQIPRGVQYRYTHLLPRFRDLILRRSDHVFWGEAVLLLQFLQRR
jgi:hypothetical protein